MHRNKKQENLFAQPFAEVWQHSPFHPSSRVATFLDGFMEGGRFNADRFWEFVTVVGSGKARKPTGREAATQVRRAG